MEQQLSSSEDNLKELLERKIIDLKDNDLELINLGKQIKLAFEQFHYNCGSQLKARISIGSIEEAKELKERRTLFRQEVEQSLALINSTIESNEKVSELSSITSDRINIDDANAFTNYSSVTLDRINVDDANAFANNSSLTSDRMHVDDANALAYNSSIMLDRINIENANALASSSSITTHESDSMTKVSDYLANQVPKNRVTYNIASDRDNIVQSSDVSVKEKPSDKYFCIKIPTSTVSLSLSH